jgi:hypothetical protein
MLCKNLLNKKSQKKQSNAPDSPKGELAMRAATLPGSSTGGGHHRRQSLLGALTTKRSSLGVVNPPPQDLIPATMGPRPVRSLPLPPWDLTRGGHGPTRSQPWRAPPGRSPSGSGSSRWWICETGRKWRRRKEMGR